VSGFDALAEVWQRCFELSWQAYVQGSLPIAAVITDAKGRVVAIGQNQIATNVKQFQISGHALAHAELNAMLQLDETKLDPRTCTLYSSLEPCPMCMGAIRMMGIRHFQYACRDPWVGSSEMLDLIPAFRTKAMKANHLNNRGFERCIGVLMVLSYLKDGLDTQSEFFRAWQHLLPQTTSIALRYYQEENLEGLIETKATARDVFNVIA